MRYLATALMSALILAACTKPADTVIPSDISTWDKELAPAIQKLTEAERQKVAAYLMRAKVGEVMGGKGVPVGITIGQALAEQSKWEAEQAAKRAEEAALKQKLEQERAAALKELNQVVTVTLVAKKQLPKDYDADRYSPEQSFHIGIQNNSDKPVVGVAGRLVFIDIFDKEVGAVSFRASEAIAPGKSITWKGTRDYNDFIDEHRAVWNLEEGKYTTRFVPNMVVFQDGTKLAMPD